MLFQKLLPAKQSLISFNYISNTGTISGGFVTSLSRTLSVGAAPLAGQKRIIYLGVGIGSGTTSDTITSATCNGTAMTQVVRGRLAASGQAETTIYKLEVNTGTTATFVVTKSGSIAAAGGFFVYSLIADAGATILDFDTSSATGDPLNFSIDTPATLSYVLAAAFARNRTAFTWTGITENVDFDTETSDFLSGASSSFYRTQTAYAFSADTGNTGNQVAGCAVTIST